MTAQQNDDNAQSSGLDFTYPQAQSDDNSVTVSQPAAPGAAQDDSATQVPAPTPTPTPSPVAPVDDTSRGNMVSGPTLETVDSPAAPEEMPSTEGTVEQPTVEGTVPSSPMPDPAVSEVADPNTQFVEGGDSTESKPEEAKENPLQALARKLSQLKSELIEDDGSKADTTAAPTSEEPAMDSGEMKTEEIVAPESGDEQQNMPEMPAMPEVSAPVEPTMESTPSESTEEMAMPTDQQTLEDTVDTEMPTEPADAVGTAPMVGEQPTDAVAPLSNLNDIMPTLDSVSQEASTESTPDSTVEGTQDTPMTEMPMADQSATPAVDQPMDGSMPSTEEVAPSTDLPGVSVAETSTTDADMSQTGPEAVMPDASVATEQTPVDPSTQGIVNQNEPNLLDESDSTEVSEEKAEEASAGSKYPLSINKLLDIAVERNASDLLISVGYPAMLRVDGTLVAVNDHIISPDNAVELVYPVLSDQKKELLEVNREVDLAYSHGKSDMSARFRINAFFSRENLAAAFRLIPTTIRTIDELQLPQMYNQFTNLNQGLILVTGPTGHGKSTTIAAIIQAINVNRAVHVITIEDPIEYIFPKSKAVIDQREMHDDTHSWTIALKSALRQDPDVILVGEMRDYETIASAITLAETGHLVFATLHTNSAAQTVDRIIDVFPENQQAQVRTQLANIIEAVIAQRLIPLDSGGRRAVSEIMLGTPAVRNLIREGKTHQIDNVIRTSADIGMVSLEHSLVSLVREGLITMEKAQEYAVHPEEVTRLLKS